MIWKNDKYKLDILSWCREPEESAMQQAANLAGHPMLFHHVALMPDAHTGYGMPIGGVVASESAVIPYAVGVDIGCGMGAVKTDLKAGRLSDMKIARRILDLIKKQIPLGEGNCRKAPVKWKGFSEYFAGFGTENYSAELLPGWLDEKCWYLAERNLGTLGGGNHFIEIQKDRQERVWLMLHSGSRNLGFRIAGYYHKKALALNEQMKAEIPDRELAFLPLDSGEGKDYIRDMNFALEYARENRRIMMDIFRESISDIFPKISFEKEINIHHNYAAPETHFGRTVWVHRKGATSAKKDEYGIIPGSMGTSSYIVKGKGNPDSFMSCSHGAGRRMGRNDACRKLDVNECNSLMKGIVFDRWPKRKMKDSVVWDLSEAPPAYKDIDEVIEAELDLVDIVEKMSPVGVLKG